jgi:hypothetical protein
MKEEFEDTKRVIINPYIEKEQTTQWPKEKVQKDKQRSTKHTYKTIEKTNSDQQMRYTEDWVTGNLLNPGVNWSAMEVSAALIKPLYANMYKVALNLQQSNQSR